MPKNRRVASKREAKRKKNNHQMELRPIKDRRASLCNVLVILCKMYISESCSLVSLFVIDPAVVE